jgi:DNA-binding winged helix-turn-helix (wHTH) protein
VLPREEIYQRGVGAYAKAPRRPSVDVFVRKLRQKLEKASPRWRYIHTHFGIGYRFGGRVAGFRCPSRWGHIAVAAESRRGASLRRTRRQPG